MLCSLRSTLRPPDKSARLNERFTFGDLHSYSPAMKPVFRTLQKIAPFDLSVLFTGVSGVGKTRIARALHQASARSKGPFVTLDCGSVPDALLESELFGHQEGAFTGAVSQREGVFRAAHGGTLLLDEVSAASPAMQISLLRALESKEVTPLGSVQSIPVDVRVLATTSEDLKQRIEQQAFRADLFYRLAVVIQELPPLDARPEDIPLLAQDIARMLSRTWNLPHLELTPPVLQSLRARTWPGNIRELENVIKRAAALAGDQAITAEHLAPVTSATPIRHTSAHVLDDEWIRSGPIAIHKDTYALPVLRDHLEQLAIQRALDACDQNQSQAAQLLDMPRRTLVHKLAQWRDQSDSDPTV